MNVNFIRQFFQVLTAPFRMIFRLPMWILSAPRKLFGLSLPARVALVFFLLMFVCVLAAFLAVWWGSDEADVWNYIQRWQTPVIGVLMIAVPVVIYFGLRSWLEKEVSLYPDIDDAWSAGLNALDEQGLDLNEMAVFLILGGSSSQEVRTLFEATRKKFLVKHVPQSKSPLHWYADEDAIYLVSVGASQLSLLNSLAGQGAARPATGGEGGGGNIRGTIDAGQFMGQSGGSGTWQPGAPQVDEEDPSDYAAPRVSGTLVPGAVPSGSGSAPAASAARGSSVTTRRETEEQTERLRYLCRLLVRARQPLCPMNGVMTVLPFPVIRDVMVAKEVPAAVQCDLLTIQQTTRMCSTVTALVTGMETESGFTELVRRVGADGARGNRFGKGYNVWNATTQENMDAFSAHACGAFEDWVYSLFREKGGMDKRGNPKLYTLLCRIRSEVRGRLRSILTAGYSNEPDDENSDRATVLFSGCYFAATGDTEDRQAFVRNVFEKMAELEEDLDWTDRAWDDDDRYLALSRFFMGVSGLAVVAMIAMVVYKFLGPEI